MFHRVKSELQETEQEDAKQPESAAFRQEKETAVRARDEQEETVKEETSTRSYGRGAQEQKEESSSAVQGKYSRNNSDSEEETRSSNYQPSVTRSSYGGGSSSYTAPSYSPSSAPASSRAQAEPLAYSSSAADRTLTIGRGINMSGEIDACDHLFVEGTVEAALKGAKVLEIAESGTFYGTVEIEEATIAGRFEGDLTVNGRLTVKASGVVTGSIAYRELEVESGAVIDGRLTPLKEAVDQKSIDKYRAGTEASAMAKSRKDSAPSKKENREPANAERGLFSKAHASY